MADPHAKEIPAANVDGSLAELVTRAEYDVQIATAKRYPRSVKQFVNSAMEMVTLNEQVADDCIYALPRDGKTIEGPSARFAELILHAWGHTRAGARIVNEDSRFITAQGVCHDLQSNTLIAFEVRRRITKSGGAKYSDDMVGVTGNAASSIALRNAVLKAVSKVFWDPIYQAARQVVMGDHTTLANRRATALTHLQKFGATPEMVFKKLGVAGVEDVTLDHLVLLRGIATALKEGDSTVEQMFAEEKPEAATKTEAVKDKLKENLAGQKAATDQPKAEPKPDAPPSLTLQDWLDDIRDVPTAEGLIHKAEQALTAFADDKQAVAAINHSAALRKKALSAMKPALPAEAASRSEAATQTAQSPATGTAPSSLKEKETKNPAT
jgi:hypothetical protein